MIGTKFSNRYEILSEIGRGGMGIVYQAHDPLLEREVAIKIVSPDLWNLQTEERFKREARTVAKMDHPAIVGIHDMGEQDGILFLVMPFLTGSNLRHFMTNRLLRIGDLLDIGIQVAEALEYSHQQSVIHRDIKPENIIVLKQEQDEIRVRITDFGLATPIAEGQLTESSAYLGTLSYLSPEQLSRAEIDERSDVYSLGTVLYECLSGEAPFSGEIQSVLYRIVHEAAQPLRSTGITISEELESIVMSCLEKNPARRPQRAGDLARALARFGSSLSVLERSRKLSSSRNRPAAIQNKRAAPFVSREKELAALQRRLNASIHGECQLALIGGDAGVGKTRLVDEVESLARVRGIRILHGRFIEQDQAFPFQGFCEAIQEYFRKRLSTRKHVDFSDLASDLVSLFPGFAELPEFQPSTGSLLQPAMRKKIEDRTYTFELLARCLTRIAGGKPLVLLFEDLHGANVSLDALQYIVRRLGTSPVFIIGTYRSSEVGKRHPLTRLIYSFQGDSRFVLISLEPFSRSEHRFFVDTLLGTAKTDPVFAGRLYDATEGNPYFTKEILRSLNDMSGIVVDDSGASSLSPDAVFTLEALPLTIQQAVERRIERLSDPLRRIFSIAAILGKTFDYRDLEMLAQEENLDESVEQLVDEGFLEEEPASRGDRLTFSSGVVREVVYSLLPRRKRRSLHLKYAEYLENRHRGRLERVYPQLIHHYAEADVAEKVVDYGLIFARKSLENFYSEEAIRSAKMVIDFHEELEKVDVAVEGEARTILGSAYRMAGNIDAALKELALASGILECTGDSKKLLNVIVAAAESAWESRRIEESRKWVEKGVDVARTLSETGSLTRLLSLGATLSNLRGDSNRAREYLEEVERLQPVAGELVEPIVPGGKLVVAFPTEIRTLQPAAIRLDEEQEICPNVFEPLLLTDAQGNVIPNLCEKWEALERGKAFLLSLRQGVRMQDGRIFTAEEAKQSLENAIDVSRNVMPAAFLAIRGVPEFLEGLSKHVEGIQFLTQHQLRIDLVEPLLLYPALLTDVKTAITLKGASGDMIGTGPFRIASFDGHTILLERNPFYWKSAPLLEQIEFRTALSSTDIAKGLRSGQFDLGRDLQPADLEELLRDRRLRAGLVEVPKKNLYFVLFNTSSSIAQITALRKAMCGIVPTHDLVWRSLGRLAQPAEGLFPPGILGHDPGRRRIPISREAAIQFLQGSLPPEMKGKPLHLNASVHPIFQDRYASLTSALFKVWSDIGIEISIRTPTMASFLESLQDSHKYDLIISRWVADYDDPDTFTYGLFHSRMGDRRQYYSSPETDELIEEARAESQPLLREKLYRKIENLILESAYLLPLFHDIDYRLANPKVRRLTMKSSPPYVNYAEIGKIESGATVVTRKTGGGIIHIPLTARLHNLDPAVVSLTAESEVIPNIFETLTRETKEARIIPWLPSEIRVEDGGKRFRFRLREDVRFHDGRRLTARDVRYSFERLLQDPNSPTRWLLSPVRGARELLAGEVGDLQGFRILSSREFTMELDHPLSFFPAILTYISLAILPEGSSRFIGTWKEGCVGTGPFRVVTFEPGQLLELEANPYYWRPGYPKSDGLVFHFGLKPEQILSDFRNGQFALAWDFSPSDVDALLREPEFALGYRETPRLCTYYLVFNNHRGPLMDENLRHRLYCSIDIEGLVRRNLGRLAIPAYGLIPPGLLGYNRGRRALPNATTEELTEEVELTCMTHSVYEGPYSAVCKEVLEAFRANGFRINLVNTKSEYFDRSAAAAEVDVNLTRWIGDYPDADTFIYGLLHSQKGHEGRFCSLSEIDALIEEGRTETDLEARHRIYLKVEDLISRHALLRPLFYEQAYRFARAEVEDFEVRISSPLVAYEKIWIRK